MTGTTPLSLGAGLDSGVVGADDTAGVEGLLVVGEEVLRVLPDAVLLGLLVADDFVVGLLLALGLLPGFGDVLGLVVGFLLGCFVGLGLGLLDLVGFGVGLGSLVPDGGAAPGGTLPSLSDW